MAGYLLGTVRDWYTNDWYRPGIIGTGTELVRKNFQSNNDLLLVNSSDLGGLLLKNTTSKIFTDKKHHLEILELNLLKM